MATVSTSERQKVAQNPQFFLHFWLGHVLRATTARAFSTSGRQKVVRTWSGPNLTCFDTFDLEMCFAPQRRALFRHLNFQKWSEAGVFFTFWLGDVLRATTASTFSTSQLPKLVWDRMVFDTFDLEMCFAPQRRALLRQLNFQKCSEREVFLPFLLTNVLRATTARTFSSLIWPAGSAPAALAKLLFDPPEPQIIGRTQWIATSLPFRAPASCLFWLSPSLIFSLLDFSSLTLPTSAFPSLHIVGSLTSKLPSTSF